jgi:transposase
MSKRRRDKGRIGRSKAHETRSSSDELTPLDPNVAGIDIGSSEHYVAVRDGSDGVIVRSFDCFTVDLREIAQWLRERGVLSAVMEATGVYWVPVYEALEDCGLKVILVDARYSKNLPGRKKTDVYDCSWLRKLQSYGMLKASFVPSKDIAEMRTYSRQRMMLVQEAARQIQLIQKSLEQMNLQLHKVITDISGVTGLAIIRAIVNGERNPLALAQLRQHGVKNSEETIAKALEGNWRPQHLFALEQAVDAYDFVQRQIQQCDTKLESCMASFTPKVVPHTRTKDQLPADCLLNTAHCRTEPSPEHKPKRQRRTKNQPQFDLRTHLINITGVDLTKIDGIDVITAQTVISEYGPDFSAFETEGRFTSHLGLCPNNRITGGKVKSSSTRKVTNRTAQALRLAAQSLHHNKSALGAFYRRMRARLGAPSAITATAHKLARLVYCMIKHGEEYVDRGQQWYEDQYQQSLQRRLQKDAARLGFHLVSATTGEVVS